MAASEFYFPSPEINRALKNRSPIVALESTVVTHGLPYPQNLQLARDMESEVRRAGAVPATVALIDGKIRIGLMDEELSHLASSKTNLKISRRDITRAVMMEASGGTTVAATMFAASRLGIRVFATGGIGGVHRESPFDISADLRELAITPMMVVCAGAKAILDLPATLEYLETMSVPVVGFKTDEFPAFYSQESGLKVSMRLDTPQSIAEFWLVQRLVGLLNAVLVANPIPKVDAIPRNEIEPVIERAVKEAHDKKVSGQQLTPFLLQRLSELTNKKSMRANLSLLLNNARLASQIAIALATLENRKEN